MREAFDRNGVQIDELNGPPERLSRRNPRGQWRGWLVLWGALGVVWLTLWGVAWPKEKPVGKYETVMVQCRAPGESLAQRMPGKACPEGWMPVISAVPVDEGRAIDGAISDNLPQTIYSEQDQLTSVLSPDLEPGDILLMGSDGRECNLTEYIETAGIVAQALRTAIAIESDKSTPRFAGWVWFANTLNRVSPSPLVEFLHLAKTCNELEQERQAQKRARQR